MIGRFLRSSKINFLLRFAIGGIFVYAGFTKLLHPKAFAVSISHYDLVPEQFLPLVAIGLPLLEFIAGLGLMFNVRGSLTAIFGMLVLFIVVLWYGILKDLSIDCGCFTPEEIATHDSLRKAFYRDIVMIIAVIIIYVQRYLSFNHFKGQRLWLIKLL